MAMNRMPLPGRQMDLKPPDAPMGDSPDEEAGEPPCNAPITTQQLDELKTNGTVELMGDDGEKVILTMDEGEAAGAPPEGAGPGVEMGQ